MRQYLNFLSDVLVNGAPREDRTGTGTLSVFGRMIRYDLADGFPLLTTKALHWRSIVGELLWFISGNTNAKWLEDRGINIWREWGCPTTREMGPIYGKQWRNFNGTDQIATVIQGIKDNPTSRRHIVSAWNPAEIDAMALPPCHVMFQFYVEDGRLSSLLTQRSADVFLGIPFNIASYALLTTMIAQVVDLRPGTLIHSIGDAHLYFNHIKQAKDQLKRAPRGLPTLTLNAAIQSIDDFGFDDILLEDYNPLPSIKAEVSI